MIADYDSILRATPKNAINSSKYYSAGKGLPDHGVPMAERSYTLGGDRNVLLAVVFVFVVVALTLYHSRLLLAFRLKKYFTSKRIYSDENVNDNRNEVLINLVVVCVGAFSQSLLLYHCLSEVVTFPSYYEKPYWIIGFGTLMFFVFVYLRAVIYQIVNWTFFDHERIRRWINGFFLVTELEAYAFYVVALMSVFPHFDVKSVIISSILIVFVYELLLLYKLIVNFTNNFYGVLLIILYFCSVELMPIALAWHFLSWVFNSNLVNNLLT